jgi:thiosulfate/3-mercaptopyruvate sulfurtransferase
MEPLITPKELAPYLTDLEWVVVDCRHSLTDPAYGRKAYAAGHLPTAVFAELDQDLCGTVRAGTGRHPLPSWDAFCRWLGRRGVHPRSFVVAYDDSHGAYASRLWWMLRALGHERTAVLDGGYARWVREERPVEQAVFKPRPATYRAKPDAAMMVNLGTLQRELGQAHLLLVDARAAERYRGEHEPIDPRAGHIPGAVNLPFLDNVDADGVFLPAQQLRRRLRAAFGSVAPERTVHYCGSGVTACHNLLAMAVAGMPMGRLYPGSWSQWCADPDRPAELGEAPGHGRGAGGGRRAHGASGA